MRDVQVPDIPFGRPRPLRGRLFLCWRKLGAHHGLHQDEASPSRGPLYAAFHAAATVSSGFQPCLWWRRGVSGRLAGGAVVEPLLKREGNLRFAGVPSAGYPADALPLAAGVRERLSGVALVPYGPLSLLFSVPPDDLAPAAWDCQVGVAVTGQPVAVAGVTLEDYRNLYALSL